MRRFDFALFLIVATALAACGDGSDPEPDPAPELCDIDACLEARPEIACTTDGTAVREVQAFTGCDQFGVCQYEFVDTACEYGCQDAACVIPCGGLTCNNPPDSECDGNSAVVYGQGLLNPNTCRCTYPDDDVDCGDDICFDGECRDFSCDFVQCQEPPESTCDGNFAVVYPEVGTCDENTRGCVYDERVTDCAAAGEACVDGACVDNCADVVCDSPPSNLCTGNTSISWDSTGTCDISGNCDYEGTETDCSTIDAECTNGLCVLLCDPLNCTDPPEPSCIENTAVRFTDAGTCNEALECVYDLLEEDCSSADLVCVDGACVTEPTCDGVECVSPTDPFCVGQTAHRFSGPGECRPGPECVYPEVTEDCTLSEGTTCFEGECAPFCDVTVCNAGPTDYCDGETAVQHAFLGDCNELTQACDYPSVEVDCAARDEVCFEGACVGGCVAELCTTPPDDRSCSGSLVIGLSDEGFCTGEDECGYPSTVVTDCADSGRVCAAGECLAACGETFCNAPAIDSCDGDELVQLAEVGACEGGVCNYAETRTNCRDSGLACIVDPADGGAACRDGCEYLECTAPPENYCDGDTLMLQSFPSSCEESECRYAETPFDCSSTGDICVDGACVDPCMGIICDAPPSDSCEGSVAVDYRDIGACTEGICDYTSDVFDCATAFLDCVDASCIDACAGVLCDSPPADGCYGTELVDVSEGDGVCIAGDCTYFDTSRVDCAETGLSCEVDACVDLCAGLSCTSPPPAGCEDDIRTAYGTFGSCTLGDCDYPRFEEDCQESGSVCAGGECGGGCDPSACESVSATCDGEFVRVQFDASPPVCIDGLCERDGEEFDCRTNGQVCTSGVCVSTPDICAAMDCSQRDPFCDRDQVVTHSGDGICVLGPPSSCDYAAVEARVTCPVGDGCFAGVCTRVPQPGEVVISEIFFDADGSDFNAEWIELYNPTSDVLELGGIEVDASNGGFLVDESVVLFPGSFVVLAPSTAVIGPDFVYDYFRIPLRNGSDTLTVSREGRELDQVTYDLSGAWPGGPGESLSLDSSLHDATENNSPSAWCSGALGSPGSSNGSCP